MTKESVDSLIHSQERPMRWKENFKKRFSWLNTKVDILLSPVIEIMRVNTAPPSEMGVIRETSFSKRYKADGSDWLSPMLTSELTKFLELVQSGEPSPNEWYEPVIVPT